MTAPGLRKAEVLLEVHLTQIVGACPLDALRIQAEPGESLYDIALELGYTAHSALSQQVRRAFEMRPGQIRGTLGWEWLLDGWVTVEVAAATLEAGG